MTQIDFEKLFFSPYSGKIGLDLFSSILSKSEIDIVFKQLVKILENQNTIKK
jgi:hypothetical protein